MNTTHTTTQDTNGVPSSGGVDVPSSDHTTCHTNHIDGVSQILELDGICCDASLGQPMSSEETFIQWLSCYRLLDIRDELCRRGVCDMKSARGLRGEIMRSVGGDDNDTHTHTHTNTHTHTHTFIPSNESPANEHTHTQRRLSQQPSRVVDDTPPILQGLSLRHTALLRLAMYDLPNFPDYCRPLLLRCCYSGEYIASVTWTGCLLLSSSSHVPTWKTLSSELIPQNDIEYINNNNINNKNIINNTNNINTHTHTHTHTHK
eukprot:GHVR01107850.1.p1 GENE.GHVR01107850.1~~GHVR01107850.1.p1  ORF type:complete len:289 (+),score=157.06 GHVR01107850.1:87-869(+)